MKKLYIPLLVILVGFASLGIYNVTTTKNKLQLKEIQLKSTASDLKELELKYDHLNFELDKADKTNKQQIKQLQDEKVKLEQEKQKLEADLLAKRDAKEKANQASQAALALGSSTAHAASVPQSGAKAFIYEHESGNNPGAINPSSGACGLGQALPCSKMPCSLSDYACQDNFFTGYMQQRYGTWENAKVFWLAHGWW